MRTNPLICDIFRAPDHHRMHGRLKVKTSAQQEAEKKKERAVKLAGYRQAMAAILSRRSEGRQDEQQLKLTGQVLLANPDLNTLWNIRRESLAVLAQTEAVWWRAELGLTQQCLMTNPKSYGAWHHRWFCLDQAGEAADWEREVGLCDRFLEADERNFHCWDYRQAVAVRAGRGEEAELEFSREKINKNFSNYSAWHYRSKLLTRSGRLEEEVQHAELDLVQNAAFTDPEDSSAWFYHTWLLQSGGDQRPVSLLYLEADLTQVRLATTRPVSLAQIKVRLEPETSSVTWTEGEDRFRTEWVGQVVSPPTRLVVELNDQTLTLDISAESKAVLGREMENISFNPRASEATEKVLLEELENCNQLIELEPDSKWPIYTKAMIMKTLDCKKYFNQILDTFSKLESIDSLRKNYYQDQKSKLTIETLLENSENFDSIDLSGHKLSKIYYKQYLNFFKEVLY